MQFTSDDIQAMETRYRAAFINSLSGFKSANLIGSSNARGQTNLAVMSSCVHVGSNPPLLALVVRPGAEERHTLSNILATQCYTINHVNSALVEQAHQTAARYPSTQSEFAATGLQEHWEAGFDAPFVADAHIKLGMALRDHQLLDINETHLVIGEIVFAQMPDDVTRTDGSVDLGKAGSVALSGLDTYHSTTVEKRMAYAKPELPPRILHPETGEPQ